MKYKLYTIPLLRQKIVFVFCNGDKEFTKVKDNKEIKKYLESWCDDLSTLKVNETHGMCFDVVELSRPIILYVKSTLKKYDLEETISHEIAHVIFYLQKMNGFKEETEFTAYLTGAINADFREFIKNK